MRYCGWARGEALHGRSCNLGGLVRVPVECMRRVSRLAPCLQCFTSLYSPLDVEPGDTWLLDEHLAPYAAQVDDGRRVLAQLFRVVGIVDVVADPDELGIAVRARE